MSDNPDRELIEQTRRIYEETYPSDVGPGRVK